MIIFNLCIATSAVRNPVEIKFFAVDEKFCLYKSKESSS